MQSISPAVSQTFKPRKRVYFDWDDLIDYIADGSVVPVCGQELLRFTVQGKELTLMQFLATEALKGGALELDDADLDENATFMDIVYAHLHANGELGDIYRFVGKALENMNEEPPKALQQLASIRSFDLFVSTTFDNYLAKALNQVRFGGRDGTLQLAFPNKRSREPDLPAPRGQLGRPVVYQIFGQRSKSQNYAVTEADLLEYVSSLSDDSCRPDRLFRELQDNHLLFLGTGHRGWLARFLLRITRNMPLGVKRQRHELIVERGVCTDNEEIIFLDRFCTDSRVNVNSDAVEFIAELHARIQQTRPDLLIDAAGSAPVPESADSEIPEGAVFLSYASEDRDAVFKLYERLSAAGIPVWMDRKGGVNSGDYEQRIKRGIKRCSVFLPVFSKTISDPSTFDNRYFRAEWDYVVHEILPKTATNIDKVQPICICAEPVLDEVLPVRFRPLHQIPAVDGNLQDDDVRVIVEMYRAWVRRNRGGQP